MRAALLVATVALVTAAQPLVAQQPGGAAALPRAQGRSDAPELAQIVATVEGVDAANRMLVLRGPKGEGVTMDVSDEVRNLPQLKAGARVIVTYAQALALELRKDILGGARFEPAGAGHATPTGRSADGIGRVVKVVADVSLVNISKQTVTLRGPTQRVTLKLRDAAQLKDITAGDRVTATYTEALAVAVRAAPSSSGGH
jgi:hypothetical protein